MNQTSTFERKAFQLFTVILTIICFVPGGASAFGGMNGSAALGGAEAIFQADSILRGFADNQYRFGFGVFFAQGLVLIYFLRDISKHANLFRVVALGLFVGGLARISNVLEFGLVDSQVVGPIVIEIIVVPLLALWHSRVIRNH
ncbi:DUF4345 domain-containing protein [Psychrobium sp. MM17-31]|uniref:DUF4345 domain-containing protein n=1 Tax=Psychrobium sp. MM17-31 TaxID=2917758 RepID=UPI001EF5C569|nr:DUF4345 domain-containing protein [Psychrobium sp. MM17-31]MCG7532766.1 DUF4345 domain-containing protein [Psychrobium sp. MM17-31]